MIVTDLVQFIVCRAYEVRMKVLLVERIYGRVEHLQEDLRAF